MQLLDAGQQLATRPSPNPLLSPGWANNAPASSPPTIADPDTINAIMAELIQFLTSTGQMANKANVGQVMTAVLMLCGVYGVDSGGAGNEYVVAPALPLPALQDGQRVLFYTARANTAAATLQLTPLAAQPIAYAAGGALGAGAINPGLTEVFWNAGLSSFLLPKPPRGSQLFTSSGNFTVPGGVYQVFAKVTAGGGGGGGGDSTHCGSGGGAGGTALALCAVTPGQVIAVTVGAGGASTSGDNPAADGGSSSFGSFCSASGGGHGTAANGTNNPGGAGGAAAGSGTNLSGGYGTDGYYWSSASQIGGNGGASYWGGGGRAAVNAGSAGNMAGQAPGSGAGGAYDNGGAVTGGTGAAGIVELEW